MTGLFRSEEMALCELYIQSEASYNCVAELGELGLVQFLDMNQDVNAFQRKFVNEIRRCEEMERKLRFLEKEINKDELPIFDIGENTPAPPVQEMIQLESSLEKIEAELKEINVNMDLLKKNYLELTEMKHVLKQTQQFFEEAGGVSFESAGVDDDQLGLVGDEAAGQGGGQRQLGFVAGVVVRERIVAFERMLWRVCHGNVFVRHSIINAQLEDPVTGVPVSKNVFIIFFQGDQLKARVKKICDGFHATQYPCPESKEERMAMQNQITIRINDLKKVLEQTQEHRQNLLVGTAKTYHEWNVKVKKIKAIYHTLNLFNLDVTRKCLIAEAWCPVNELDRITVALKRGTDASGSLMAPVPSRIDTTKMPPTFHRGNKIVDGYQSLVDAYAIATYREVNPAPFTIVTFPFLFGVMFGDIGHGLIMFLVALWMVLREKQLKNQKNLGETMLMFFNGRYIILMMGVFSIYAGMLYNDMFAKSINVFGSSWYSNYTNQELAGNSEFTLEPSMNKSREFNNFKGQAYPFGVDPVWQLGSNKITFQDSFKMKLSVILGVSQMVFGLCLSLVNHIHFKRPLNIVCEFIPQMLFMCCVFVYMDLWIIYKWLAYDADTPNQPSILMGIINMVLFTYPSDPSPGAKDMADLAGLQIPLMLVAIVCVPWILCAKPLIKRKHHMAQVAALASSGGGNGAAADTDPLHQATSTDGGEHGGGEGHGEGDGEFNFGEVFIYQAIHTIEFVLGTISHSASYLRLWALSLAHSQLSEVLWNMVMQIGFNKGPVWGAFILAPIFAAWASATVIILVCMEGLSAFLHALRLHWIEFQSKFYIGEGHAFAPFSFAKVLEQED